jgi:hypothetical protein
MREAPPRGTEPRNSHAFGSMKGGEWSSTPCALTEPGGLVCVRWFFDRGGVYVGDCRWLPGEIVVKPIQAAE